MATTYNVRYVDVDADAGGDGTTTALTGGTCAFKSLNIWEAARDADLTGGDGGGNYVVERAICGSAHANHTADTTAVTIDGWTTSANSYIDILTDASNRAGCSWDTSKYRHAPVVAWGHSFTVNEEYVRVDGLQASNVGSGGYAVSFSYWDIGASTDLRVSACYIKAPSPMTIGYTSNVKVWNTILLGATVAISVSSPNTTTTLYSCTVISTGAYGLFASSGAAATAKNCYFKGTTAAISGAVTQTNCATSDASADGTNPLDNIAYDTDTFVNVTAGSEDFHLAADGLSPLVGAGVDTSGESAPLNFTTDILGTTRS